ncbi:restriction endonuclease subunit S [Evansella sp. AB-rgal1]|uniref:restriction endonuclease subunit S n=1 Tax=Evansella sp. AB-rgal1 TaxID=3242696 RepID=UPI00359D4FCB
MTNKRPEIQFSGFNHSWEQRKLGEVVDITMGQSPNGENYTGNPDDHILVQGNADIKNGWVVPRVWTTQVTKSADKGDILLSVRAPVGDVGKTQYDVVLGRGVAGIKGNEFIYQSLNRMKSDGFWTRYTSGSTFESINSNALKEAPINVPGEDEQTKIGEYFKQLDDIITLHQLEIEKVVNLKKAMLQKMFPRNGNCVPEVRFEGFTGDWEQRKLGDCVDYIKGYAFKSEEYRSDGIRIVRVSDLSSNEIKSDNEKIFIDRESEKEYQRYKLNVGDIIITTVGSKAELRESAVGRPIIVNKDIDGLLNQNLVKITPINEYDSNFIYLNLLSVKYIDYIASIERGNANQANIALNDLWQYTIYLTSNMEQQKIGSFFKQLDDTITLYQERLNKFKQIKKSMFIKMFI